MLKNPKIDQIEYNAESLENRVSDIQKEVAEMFDTSQTPMDKERLNLIFSSLQRVQSSIGDIKGLCKEPLLAEENKNIYVCSAYGGSQENYEAAKEYCQLVQNAGFTPFASHVMLHDVLDDNAGRAAGLKAGTDMVSICSEVWVFGDQLTEGMKGEIYRAKQLGIPVEMNPVQRLSQEQTPNFPELAGRYL